MSQKYKIGLSNKLGTEVHELTRTQLATLCLEICGGGITDRQTMEAAVMMQYLKEGKMIRSKHGTWFNVEGDTPQPGEGSSCH